MTRPCPPACALPRPPPEPTPWPQQEPMGASSCPPSLHVSKPPWPIKPLGGTALPQQPPPPPLPHSECGHKGWPPVVAPQAALSPSLVVLPKRSGLLRAQPPADHESPPTPPSPRSSQGLPPPTSTSLLGPTHTLLSPVLSQWFISTTRPLRPEGPSRCVPSTVRYKAGVT